jgi:23S rRNA (guanosine2251-2'-O)-methyltransferase
MTMGKETDHEYISGVNPVFSLMTKNAGRRKIYEIFISRNRKKGTRTQNIIAEARKRDIKVIEVEPKYFQKLTFEDDSSQGVCARVSPYNYCDLKQYLDKENHDKERLIILDGVTDVGNFGSIIRNCAAFDCEGIIIPKRRSASVNKRLSSISAGAIEEIKVFRVVNTVRAIKQLKERGFWIYGTTLDLTPQVKYLNDVDFIFPMAVIFGSEDRGISRLAGVNCDVMVSIRLSGTIQSLNVSVASGIILYRMQEQIERERQK